MNAVLTFSKHMRVSILFPGRKASAGQLFRKNVQCAAVAAAAGALRAAGFGTAVRGPPPLRRRPHKFKIFEILIFWLRKFWSEIGPNGPRTDPERTLNGSRTDPERNPNESRTDPKRPPNGTQTNPERTPNGLRTDPHAPKSSPKHR